MALINCPECGKQISNKAVACPECGYPIKPQEKNAYSLHVGTSYGGGGGFASFLKVCSVICWIGGIIISIVGAFVPVISGYSNKTEFSFSTFLTLMAPFAIDGALFWGVSEVVRQVNGIFNMVSGLRLEKGEKEKGSLSGKPLFKTTSEEKKVYDWKCSFCGTVNSGEDTRCRKCTRRRL